MIRAYYKIDTFGKNGIYNGKKTKSKSFLKQFMQAFYHMNSSISVVMFDTTGAGRTWPSDGRYAYKTYLSVTGAGKESYSAGISIFSSIQYEARTPVMSGIILGTGITAVTVTDYTIETIIDNGVTSGKLEYLPCGVENYTVVGGSNTASFDIVRIFRNSSGGSITVNEMALYMVQDRGLITNGTYGSTSYIHCLIRDIVSPGRAIADGEYCKVTYTITVTS